MKLNVKNLYIGRLKQVTYKRYPFTIGIRHRVERKPLYLFEEITTAEGLIYQDVSSGLSRRFDPEYYGPFDLSPLSEIYPKETIGKTHAKLLIQTKRFQDWWAKR